MAKPTLTDDNATCHPYKMCFYANVHTRDRLLLLYSEIYIVDQGHNDPWGKKDYF